METLESDGKVSPSRLLKGFNGTYNTLKLSTLETPPVAASSCDKSKAFRWPWSFVHIGVCVGMITFLARAHMIDATQDLRFGVGRGWGC